MMRQLNNKHYDTNGGLLGQPTNVSSHPKPPVSMEDETMNQTIKCHDIDTFVEIIHLLTQKGFAFEADTNKYKIEILGY